MAPFILPDISSVLCFGTFCFRYSYVLILIPAFIVLLYFVIRKNMIRMYDKSEQEHYLRQKHYQRIIFFIIRSLLVTVLLLAVASPFILDTKTVKGNPRITLLVDNSTSMNLFEGNLGSKLEDDLKGKIPVSLRTIASGERSAIGNGILNNVERGENVLVVTDGSNNDGKLLGDIILLSSSLNATVSTLSMDSVEDDVGIEIVGPAEAIRDTEESFSVVVNNVGDSISYTIEVKYDNEVVLSKTDVGSQVFTFKKRLTEGYHRISAELKNVGENDYFAQNNKYYKTVKVVPRPRVLFVSEKPSLFADNLDEIYDLTTVSTVPHDLSSYLAVVMNDVPAPKFLPHLDRLSNYVSDGNGLFVIGGQQSFDRGNYKGTLIETLLPVKVGAGEDSEQSDVHIVIILDVSGTTGKVYNTNTRQYEVTGFDDIIKAQAVSVIESLDDKNNVGVVVTGARDVGSVSTLSEIVKLGDAEKTIVDKISRIDREKVGGQTIDLKFGIDKANRMLRQVSGGKNIIIISDGRGLAPRPQQDVLAAVKSARGRAIKTYVVGVGADTEQATGFLTDAAAMGGGTYFPVDASNKLKILFGEPDSKDDQDSLNQLVLLDTTHFITFNQSLDVVVTGYNYMIPKPSSRLLITTTKNIPIMAAWRFGLGRVVSLGTDDGGKWSGEFLSGDNSKVLTKGINWAIGDLTRKKNFDVRIRDVTLDDTMFVNVVASVVPAHEELSFVKSDVNVYTAKYTPERTGFFNFLGADVAVNYKKEFKDLGVSSEFTQLVQETQGKVFDKDDIDAIIEFVKEKSKRIKVNSVEYKWPFIILVLILLLIDIGVRRMWENKNAR